MRLGPWLLTLVVLISCSTPQLPNTRSFAAWGVLEDRGGGQEQEILRIPQNS